MGLEHALSAALPLQIDLDLLWTLMTSSLDRLLAVRLGHGCVKAAADITVTEDRILLRLGRRAHNPFLLNAGYGQIDLVIP